MDSIIQFLISYGYAGMFISAFLAGSVVPFNSELVIAGLHALGVDSIGLIIWGTLGNTLGGLFNYAIGLLGNENWIYNKLKVKPESLERWKRVVTRYGAWMGLLSWLPVLGEVITVALGLMRVNPWLTVLAIFIGKLVRYILIIAWW